MQTTSTTKDSSFNSLGLKLILYNRNPYRFKTTIGITHKPTNSKLLQKPIAMPNFVGSY